LVNFQQKKYHKETFPCITKLSKLRLEKGDNVADVSNQLGHHSVKFTMDTYYHWMPGKKKSEVDGLDDPIHPNAPYMHPSIANSI